ncbi:MAG: histidine--tRNA ligase [Oscillospiraceae bacterium]
MANKEDKKTVNPLKAPQGTKDLLPSESYKWQFIEKVLLEVATLFGYKELRTPTFENINLFCRGVGDTTDVVQKEMYEVKAQKSDELYALKPEGTAGAVRCAIEKGLLNDALPLKVCYITSCFRHERAQAGRFREFHQFGCEMFGAGGACADADVISIVWHIFKMLGLLENSQIKLNINSIGCKDCREEYYKALRNYFSEYKDKLCGTCLERFEKNPMRILDCKSPICQEVAKNAPVITDYLCDKCKVHFENVKERLNTLEIPFVINTKIVRGLDYYTKTVFEFITEIPGVQGTVCAGGRYDGLVKVLGGNDTPALGFAMGLERILILMDTLKINIPSPQICDIYIGSMGDKANIKACEIATKMRDEGFFAECDLMDRSVKAQMKYANKINARYSLIIGENELLSGKAILKDMKNKDIEPREIQFEKELTDILYDAMLSRQADEIANQIGSDAFSKIMSMEKDK